MTLHPSSDTSEFTVVQSVVMMLDEEEEETHCMRRSRRATTTAGITVTPLLNIDLAS